MSCCTPRRVLCGAAAVMLLISPTPASAETSPDALAPVRSALSALRERAEQWLSHFADDEPPDPSVRMLVPGGQNIGVALMCEGVLVVGTSDPGTQESPARQAGIRSGDLITHVDGVSVVGARNFQQMISGGNPVTLTVRRDDTPRSVNVQPVTDPADGEYRIGAWVRDSTAGVGTLTYIDPADDTFGALGHPIQDADTFATLPVAQGLVFDSDVTDVRRGECGAPGELVGSFMENADQIGLLHSNTSGGIFGRYAAAYDKTAALPAADAETVIPGDAQILTTLDDGAPQAYDVKIVRIYPDGGTGGRDMMVQVCDPELIAHTGGIVQGMSGSPIIQDGKLIGAVTHVLVNDPTRGYGIFIENMLEAAG